MHRPILELDARELFGAKSVHMPLDLFKLGRVTRAECKLANKCITLSDWNTRGDAKRARAFVYV